MHTNGESTETGRPDWTSGPASFGDSIAEDRAARTGAAMFDLSGRTRLVLTGKDRAKFLHGFCTNSITTLSPGEGCEAFATNIKGRILEHLFVAVFDSSLLVDATRGGEERLFAHFDRYIITEDVAIDRQAAEAGEIFVAGPRAAERLAAIGMDAADLAPNAHRPATIAGRNVTVWRIDLLGAPSYRLLLSRDGVQDVWKALAAAGVVPAGSDVFEPLRIEAGLPLYGVDLSDENLAQEAMRTARAISFRKGCYLGQEPIARLDALGHVNRQLAGIRLAHGSLPDHGARVTAADGKEVGTITSAALAPGATQPVALAILKSQTAAAGTAVSVETPAGAVEGITFAW